MRVPKTRGAVLAVGTDRDRANDFAAMCADEDSFRVWYDGAVQRVYAYLFARTGGDPALSEELTQQAFVRAIRARSTYDGRAPATAWVCAIARNLLVDHFRKRAREERGRLRVIVPEVEDDTASRHADREEVLAVLRTLPALQRAALVLRYMDGMSVRDVAAAIGKSESATESLLTRARDGFRSRAEEDDR
jgi:RNA polymerase sigma-70 factor (ECF subfamily)